MEIFLIKAAQLIAALAFLVIIHEFGHYIVARIFSIKVEKFYLFFNPWFSLAKWKPKKGKPRYDKNGNERASWRDTVYGIGWLPLGGYVKIAGMIESMDTEQMKQPAKPWEFRSKPAWQRLCVMLAGVIFNFILAILIYAGIAFYWGNKYVPLNKAYEGMDYSKVALAAGFQNGDIPYAADNHVLDISADNVAMLVADAKEVTVLRKSVSDSVLMAGVKEVARDTVTFRLPDHFLTQLEKDDMFMTFRMPVFVKKVVGGSPASEAGLLVDDRLVAVGGVPTPAYAELQEQLARHIGADGQAAVPQKGQHLAVDGHPRPAQHEGGHGQPPGQGPVGEGGHPGGHLHQPGEQPLRPGLVHSQRGQEGGEETAQQP